MSFLSSNVQPDAANTELSNAAPTGGSVSGRKVTLERDDTPPLDRYAIGIGDASAGVFPGRSAVGELF